MHLASICVLSKIELPELAKLHARFSREGKPINTTTLQEILSLSEQCAPLAREFLRMFLKDEKAEQLEEEQKERHKEKQLSRRKQRREQGPHNTPSLKSTIASMLADNASASDLWKVKEESIGTW